MNHKKITAIVLAGGKGNRMNSKVRKQYLKLQDKPILFYALDAFEKSCVDEIILVVPQGEEEYCKKTIVDFYGLKKVRGIIPGGKERYDSVYQGLKAIKKTDIVMIHDGARPFLSSQLIDKAAQKTIECKACVVGVKAKDTIKIVNEKNCVIDTPDRNKLWQVQTPQSFSFHEICKAYEYVLNHQVKNITDDAMVWETCCQEPVVMLEGSYNNIKITTKEDMIFGEAILNYQNCMK